MRISDWSSDVCSSDLFGVVAELLLELRSHGVTAALPGPVVFPVTSGRRILLPVELDDGGFRLVGDERPGVFAGEGAQRAMTVFPAPVVAGSVQEDRKSTRLNSSHQCANRMTAFA